VSQLWKKKFGTRQTAERREKVCQEENFALVRQRTLELWKIAKGSIYQGRQEKHETTIGEPEIVSACMDTVIKKGIKKKISTYFKYGEKVGKMFTQRKL
jgi:hypothetical protein